MEKYNLEKYFSNSDTKCYDAKILITIIEDILNKDLNTIKKDINELNIIVDEKQIVNYLNQKFEEEEPEVKKRIENPKPRKKLNNGRISMLDTTIEDIEESTQAFGDQLTAARYGFDSYTLNYFNKYSNIVRNKARKILNIIEKIANRESNDISNLITELDIQLDENGNITKEDIIRLILPFIHNYNSLVEKVNTANNLETYLTFKLSKHSVYRNGWSEGELYPTSSIQTKNLYYDNLKGNIPLSNNQKKVLREEQRKANKKFVKSLLDW